MHTYMDCVGHMQACYLSAVDLNPLGGWRGAATCNCLDADLAYTVDIPGYHLVHKARLSAPGTKRGNADKERHFPQTN